MFNGAGFDKRVEAGEITIQITKSHAAPPRANQPPGTLSQMIAYRDKKDGTELASAHRYYRPDGTLGGSGKPDPKSLLQNGTLYTAWWGTRIGNL
jgi:hypothetical protein